MSEQPKAWIVAALNRLFDESGARTADEGAPIRVSLISSISERYGWISVKAILTKLEHEGYIKIYEDPENSSSLHFGEIGKYIPEDPPPTQTPTQPAG